MQTLSRLLVEFRTTRSKMFANVDQRRIKRTRLKGLQQTSRIKRDSAYLANRANSEDAHDLFLGNQTEKRNESKRYLNRLQYI